MARAACSRSRLGARACPRPRWRLPPPATPRSRVFFFNDTATTEIYTLSLHDALPICVNVASCRQLMTPVIFPDFVSSEHLARIQCSETRDSPRLPARPSPVRLRKQLRDAVHGTRDPRRNLRQVPPVLHREAEAPGYGRARGAVPPEIRHGQNSRLMHGGPTPPGARAGGGGRPGPGRP